MTEKSKVRIFYALNIKKNHQKTKTIVLVSRLSNKTRLYCMCEMFETIISFQYRNKIIGAIILI